MKRLLSIFLCFIMVLSVVPFSTFAQTDSVTVYLDQKNGADSNTGLTEAKAVKTFEGAYKVLKSQISSTGKTGRIVLLSDYAYTFTESQQKAYIASTSYAHNYDITICGKTADVSLSFSLAKQSYWTMIGPTTFENLNICIAENTKNKYLSFHGYGNSYLKIGSNVTTTDDPNRQISLVAVPNSSTTKNGVLEVCSGAWRNVYAGAYSAVTVTGDTELIFNGGSCQRAAAVYNGTQQGNVSITINGGTVGQLDMGAVNTGTVTGNVTTTICGGTIAGAVTQNSIQGESTLILAPEKGVYLNTSLTVDQLTGGQLTLGRNVVLTVTGGVTGATQVTVDGGVGYGTYIHAPAATAESAIAFTQTGVTSHISDGERVWSCTDLSKIHGVILQADSAVKVELHTEFEGGELVEPLQVVTENGVTSYYYPNLSGSYRYIASGSGYYTITKNLYISPQEATTCTTINVTPSKYVGAGWEASKVGLYTDELLANKPSAKELWSAYQEAFETPFFTIPRAEHQYTTQQELEDYLTKLAAKTPNMYVFSAGQSGYGLNVPLVVFTTTDLSGAKTLEDAAALVRSNGKLTIQYQAQMHGNETAACEGALAMVQKLSGSYGNKVLKNLNVYVLPRLNPDGAQRYKRELTVTGLDMNKDFLLLRSVETQNVQNAAKLFNPTMIIDSHEYTADRTLTEDKFSDLLIGAGYHLYTSADFRDTSISMVHSVFEAMETQNLTYSCYDDRMNSVSNYVSRNYASSQGTLFFLLESRGTGSGNIMYGRRVVTHLVAATELLDYAYENHTQLSALVASERQRIIDNGATYEASDIIPLRIKNTAHPELNVQTIAYNTATGESYDFVQQVVEGDEALRFRVTPTAYVLPAERWTQQVLNLMDRHGIRYTFLPVGSSVLLQQYTGTTTEAALTEEMAVTFSGGAYVFTMNQVGAMILANLMEPDVNSISAGASTLAMAGIIPSENGVFPIYRYIHDLNSQGMVEVVKAPAAPAGLTVEDIPQGGSGAIKGLSALKIYEYSFNGAEYVKLPAGTTAITVTEPGTYAVRYQATKTQVASVDAYVDVGYRVEGQYVIYLSANGNDSKNGRTKDSAVATVAKAYSLMDSLMENAPSGAEGKIVVCGMVDLGTVQVNFPKHSYPVVIAGYAPTNGFNHEGGSASASRYVNFNGPTTVEHISWSLTNSSDFNYMCAKGNKLVIGEGFTSLFNQNNTFYNITGGGTSGTFASTDLTIGSGTWRNIYYATYTGTVNGDVKLTMTGGSYTKYLQATYTGTVEGNCTVNVSGAKLGERLIGASKSTGTVNGDITVTLGAGLSGSSVVTAVDQGALNGTYTLMLDGADTTGMTINGHSAMSGSCDSSVLILKKGTISSFTNMDQVILRGSVQLGSDITSDITVEGDSVLNLNGKVLTGNLSGSGTLYGADSANDGYIASTGRISGKVTCRVASNYKDANTLKRYLAIADAQGYTFHRFYMGMTHVNLRPTSDGIGYKAVFYGDEAVRQQVAGYGYSLWLGASDKKLTAQRDGAFTSGQVLTLLVRNFDVQNYNRTDVNGTLFITLKDGTVIESTTYSITLRSLMEQLSGKVDSLTSNQLLAVQAMIARYESIMSAWNIENLR